jgi:hypothetical protein
MVAGAFAGIAVRSRHSGWDISTALGLISNQEHTVMYPIDAIKVRGNRFWRQYCGLG